MVFRENIGHCSMSMKRSGFYLELENEMDEELKILWKYSIVNSVISHILWDERN